VQCRWMRNWRRRRFDWFAKDFKDGDVKGWLADYVDVPEGARVSYLSYDWALNKK